MHERREESTLRQLLDVEDRLQALVRAATEDAARRLATAVGARDARMAEARHAAEREDEAAAAAEAVAHATALAAIATAADAVIGSIRRVPTDRIDALARWALQQAIDGGGEPL